VTKISTGWIKNPKTQAVMAALTANGAQAYFVGGCVRNSLLGAAASDIDIATNALPEVVMQLGKSAELKAIPTGIDHGTITLVSDGMAHEVTTFRKDVETDGRRAVVSFSDSIEEDAKRRDFTMNALYADADGTVFDPLSGLADLQAHIVRFIEDADARIKEDYLRSLRFFRFFAWYGRPEAGLEPEGLAAIAANLDGLETLSKERVGAEVLKLLAAPDPAPAVAAMMQSGVLARILPGANHTALAPLVHLEQGRMANPIRRLAVLGGQDVGDLLRLSRKDERKLTTLRTHLETTQTAAELGYRLGEDMAIDVILLRAAVMETPVDNTDFAAAKHGGLQTFPVKAADLMPALSGPALGQHLAKLEQQWVDSGFSDTKEELLA
jgi:poly(A) polymerase